ncbi:MAG: PepSY-like domain-containing protein [Bacillota bacterium]
MKVRWLTIGGAALGFTGLAPLSIAVAVSEPSTTVRAVAHQRDEGSRQQPRRTPVQYEDLPRAVRNTLHDEAGGQGFTRITRVTDEGQTWYVAELNNGQTVRVDSSGNLIESPKKLSSRGRNELEEGGIERQVVPVHSLPGAVQSTINSERGQDRVTQVVKIIRGNEVHYRVRLEGPNERIRMLRLDEKGKLLAQWNATEPGRVEVKMNTLPGAVKGTLLREANGEKIEEITQVTRNNSTWYVAEIEDRSGHLRTVRVDSNGRGMHRDYPSR